MRNPIHLISVLVITSCASFQGGRVENAVTEQAAHSYLIEGETLSAKNALEKLQKTDPMSPADKFLLADILDMTGHPSLALPLYLNVLTSSHGSGVGYHESIASAMAVVAIRDRAKDFDNTILRFLTRTKFTPGKLPKEAWFQIMNLHLGISRRQGDYDSAKMAIEKAGCITKWQVAGPIGPWIWNDFQAALPPGRTFSKWPAQFDAGPGRGLANTRLVNANSCFASLRNPALPQEGKTWARSTLVLKEAGTVHFRLQTHDGARIFLGGRELLVLDPRKTRPPKVTWFAAQLPAGPIDITIMLATDSTAPGLSLAAIGKDNLPAWAKSDPFIEPEGVAKKAQLEISQGRNGLISQYAEIKIALWWDDAERAMDIIQTIVGHRKDLSWPLLMALSEALTVDESIPYELAHERARALEAKALEKEPEIWQARIHLSDRKLDDDRFLEAIEILRKGIGLSPLEPKYHKRLIGNYLDRSWWREANEAIFALEKILPNACDTLRYKLAWHRENSLFLEARKLAIRLSKCDSSSSSLAEEQSRGHDFDDAVKERKRLASRDPHNPKKAFDLYQAFLASDDAKNAMASLKAAFDLAPLDEDLVLALADQMASLGERKEGIAILEAALQNNPESENDLQDAKSILQNRKQFAKFRVDGLEIVEKYKFQKETYDTASVFVLDRAVYMASPKGGLTTIVHIITHLRTDEAVEEYGEFDLPDGAKLLTARTIKKDGRLLEPENIARKPSFSLPDLEPGDIIETEYITFTPPNPMFPGGFDTERFYFQNFQTAFHRSEMVSVIPENMDVVIDPRGTPPEMEENHKDGYRTLTWRAREILPHPKEPMVPSATEFLPSIRLTSGGTWKNLLLRIKDLLADKNLGSQTVQNALAAATRGIPPEDPRGRRAAIYRWVEENVRPENDFFSQGSHIIARRSGHPARAFMTLLNAGGYSSKLVLVKPEGQDEMAKKVPDMNAFNEFVVFVDGDGWISLDAPYAPYGYLPAELRERPGIVVDTGKRTKTDLGAIPVDKQKIGLTLTIEKNGTATGLVKETLTGILASHFRTEFEKISKSDRAKHFEERYLSREIPGARLIRLKIENESNFEAPLKLIYEIEAAGFLTREGDVHRVKIPFGITLVKQIGGLADRQTPLVLASRISKELKATILAPENWRPAKPKQKTKKISSSWGKGQSWMKTSQNKATLEYRADLKADRITTEQYGDFFTFAKEIDELTRMEIVFR